MHKLKLTTVGSSTGAVFPKELLAKLNVSKGDHLYLVETPSGYLVTPLDPEVAEQTDVAFDFMNEYRDTLRALAK